MTDPVAWPSTDIEGLAVGAEQLAERLAEPELRAQAFAIAAVLRNLGRERLDAEERRQRQEALEAAMAADDEAAVVVELRRLAALDRRSIVPVDWSKVSSG